MGLVQIAGNLNNGRRKIPLTARRLRAGSPAVPLVDVPIPLNPSTLPEAVVRFLREADRRVSRFANDSSASICGFVPSDFATVYRALHAIAETQLAAGNSFCEWGSGFGVVASMAAMLEFDACGIEIESRLVDASRWLADDFHLPVEFVHGSFIPPGGEACAEEALAAAGSDMSWLSTDADTAYDDLGLEPDDFDLIFAYPWPGEARSIELLFERYGADGALLLTYGDFGSMRLLRNVRGRFTDGTARRTRRRPAGSGGRREGRRPG